MYSEFAEKYLIHSEFVKHKVIHREFEIQIVNTLYFREIDSEFAKQKADL